MERNGRWVVSFTPLPIYPRGKSPRYPFISRMGWPQGQSGRGSERKESLPRPCRESNPGRPPHSLNRINKYSMLCAYLPFEQLYGKCWFMVDKRPSFEKHLVRTSASQSWLTLAVSFFSSIHTVTARTHNLSSSWPTPWGSELLQTLVATQQLVKKFSAFSQTRMFGTVFKRDHY
jgi:hypothetical protein